MNLLHIEQGDWENQLEMVIFQIQAVLEDPPPLFFNCKFPLFIAVQYSAILENLHNENIDFSSLVT